MNRKSTYIFILVFFGVSHYGFGSEKTISKTLRTHKQQQLITDCVRPTAQYDMNVNNVRARLLTGGDLFSTAAYITPAPATGQLAVSAIYAAGVWIGGTDRSGNIKLSAVTYRSEGYDYTSGPLDLNGTTDKEYCDDWDKIFSVKGRNIENHIKSWQKAQSSGGFDCNKVPDDVKYWPAQGNPYFSKKYGFQLPEQSLAAFWDFNGDGRYNPCEGDYPLLDDRSCNAAYHEGLKIPAEINYFIFNDAGNVQLLSGFNKMQMEVQVNAFAYESGDELNDMTFYQYKLINKASEDLIDCYFSFWIDPDLGCYQDDFIGYDPITDMAYVYNQDVADGSNGTACEGTNTYGYDIPIIGFSYVRGPLGSKVFKRDQNGNLLYDALGNKILIDPTPGSGLQDTLVELGISSFTYMENCGIGNPTPNSCDPARGMEDGFYNYMRGKLADGAPFVNSATFDTISHVFDGDPNDPNGWSMCTANLPFGDRRMLMSTGPMLMQPGSVNQLTVSIVTAFDIKHPCPDISKLRYANTLSQELFDNCFETLIVGPDAPDILGTENDKEIVLQLINDEKSNNFEEKYREKILSVSDQFDQFYTFEGYKIFQLANPNVTRQQLDNTALARLVAQSDIQNNISEIFNWKNIVNPDQTATEDYIWVPELKASGSNTGIQPSYSFTEDQFAADNKTLINGKNYHFMVVAYAHNEWKPFDINDNTGQKTPYIESFKNVKTYTFAPKQDITIEKQQLKVTRISGEGNPKVFLELAPGMYDKMLRDDFDGKITYVTGYGPLQGKIIDESKLQNKVYRLEITGDFNSNRSVCAYEDDAIWKLTDITENTVILEDKSLNDIKEYVVEELGFAITVNQHTDPGTQVYTKNGGVGQKVEYADPDAPWFSAITYENNIRNSPNNFLNFISPRAQDPNLELSAIGTGYFVPFISTRYEPTLSSYLSPAAREIMSFMLGTSMNSLRYRDLNNVDIIMTKDKAKWSKCMVVESTSPDFVSGGTLGNRKNFELRNSLSIDQNGNSLNDGTTGFSYFPGYAVDVETGKRLNIFFGESSLFIDSLIDVNGTLINLKSLLNDEVTLGGDMIFNPSSQLVIEDLVIRDPITTEVVAFSDPRALVAGGQHYIYVTRQAYDGCASLATRLRRSSNGATASNINRGKVGAAITWTSFPVLPSDAQLLPLSEGLIPNDVIIKLRVDNPYGESRVYNTERERDCETVGDHPVYEFGFDNFVSFVSSENSLERVFLSPNPTNLSQAEIGLKLYHLPLESSVSIIDLNGNLVKKFLPSEANVEDWSGPGVTETSFNVGSNLLRQGLNFVHIVDHKTGNIKTLKWMVL
jgi:hypothetical protein